MVPNEKNELVPMRPVTGWRVCMDYRKLNSWTEKDHFPMPSWIRCLIDLPEKGGTVFLMNIRGIIRFLLNKNINKEPLILVHKGPLCSKECCFCCVIHPPHFRDV